MDADNNMTTPNPPDPEKVREADIKQVNAAIEHWLEETSMKQKHLEEVQDAWLRLKSRLAQQDGGMRVTVYGGTAADHIWTQMRFDADCVVNGEFVKAGTLYRMIAASEGAG